MCYNFGAMETKVLNYRIIITPEKFRGKIVYNALSPTLGVADWGETIEKALKNVKAALECHIESLLKHKEPIPSPDAEDYMITTASISVSPKQPISFI